MCHALTQGIKQLKLLSSTKVILLIYLPQKKTQVSSVKCSDHCNEIKTIS